MRDAGSGFREQRETAERRRTLLLGERGDKRFHAARATYPLRSSRSIAIDIVAGVTLIWRARSFTVVGSISSR